MDLARWIRENAFAIASVDAGAPLDDLEPPRSLVEGGRVVAIGEEEGLIVDARYLAALPRPSRRGWASTVRMNSPLAPV